MKKFLLGYFFGSVISCYFTDYIVRTELFSKFMQRSLGGKYDFNYFWTSWKR